MTIPIKVPVLPESVADATVSLWHKKLGDQVSRDDHVVDLETDKVMLEVIAQDDGILSSIIKNTGEVVKADEILAVITPVPVQLVQAEQSSPEQIVSPVEHESPSSPSGRRIAAEHGINLNTIVGTGKDHRITKDDVVAALATSDASSPALLQPAQQAHPSVPAHEQRVPMSRMRARIAERLLDVTHSTAMLTTFNEVDLHKVVELRTCYRDAFEKKHQVKLGFMSFFVCAAVAALKRFPIVNSAIDGNDIVYRNYYDIGVAVSTERGLVVPVLRDVAALSMAEIERQIVAYASKARAGKLSLAEMQGGTFTITNGGVFGSLISTPIINAPQAAILGMHKIQDRPVVENGVIVIRPMMYLALSYDHRLIDGRESVSFLLTIKELLEEPSRLLLEV